MFAGSNIWNLAAVVVRFLVETPGGTAPDLTSVTGSAARFSGRAFRLQKVIGGASCSLAQTSGNLAAVVRFLVETPGGTAPNLTSVTGSAARFPGRALRLRLQEKGVFWSLHSILRLLSVTGNSRGFRRGYAALSTTTLHRQLLFLTPEALLCRLWGETFVLSCQWARAI